MTNDPAPLIVKLLPEIEPLPVLNASTLKVTGNPELAVAVNGTVKPVVKVTGVVSGAKVMACDA